LADGLASGTSRPDRKPASCAHGLKVVKYGEFERDGLEHIKHRREASVFRNCKCVPRLLGFPRITGGKPRPLAKYHTTRWVGCRDSVALCPSQSQLEYSREFDPIKTI
jgi:hypothetical protein